MFPLIKNVGIFLNDWLPTNFKPLSMSGEGKLLHFIIRSIGELHWKNREPKMQM